MKYMEYNHEMRKFIDSKYDESFCPELPDLVEWYKDWILILAKKKSVFISTAGKKINLDNGDMITYAKSVGNSWVMYMGGTGIFMDKNNPLPQNTIDFGYKPLICIMNFKNFVISLHDSILKVFDGSDSANIQDVQFDHGGVGRFISVNSKHVLYLVQNFSNNNPGNFLLFELKELAFEKQVSKLLTEEKHEDAMGILNNNISSSDEDKPKVLEKIFLDSAWVYLKNGNFIKALQHFKLTNYDPTSLIFLFQNELKIPMQDPAMKKYIDNQKNSIEMITANNQDLIKEGLSMLCELLLSKRNFFLGLFLQTYSGGDLNKALQSNLKIQFTQSEHALLNMSSFEMPFLKHLCLINTVVIKIMILSKYKYTHIKEVIDSENFYWNQEDLNSFLNNCESSNEAKLATAYIYERKENWESALRIWQEFGQKRESDLELSIEAYERTKKILTSTKDKDLFKEFISWPLSKFTEQTFQLYLNTEIIPIEYFYTSIIGVIDKNNPDLNLKEKFLEFYIGSGCSNERYHTMVCDLYIDKLFRLKKPNLEYADPSTFEGATKQVYDKLNNIVRSSVYYNKLHVLEKVRDSWMMDLEVYLYSQSNMHTEAISKLIAIGCSEDNFEKVEKYCLDVSTNSKTELYGEMFKMLTSQYEICVKGLSNCKTDKDKVTVQKQIDTFKKQMLSVLKKYGDNTNKLDVFLVLECLPGDW
eukprot:CAMPEP_0170516912 /NCGR_PEP_ID=MMETSP0209-20121228/3036_1 /TAXON_ID=665100 ORGANISM="Litonotus pictus, Strain P1" /NCGR_SAMPLE_ID=MMETSP0209 /ASSEMBLY_ACC=CAM_ASM_000301 /LENGTH=700 /DNA_ID=CAMNT_0010802007 /DNA_START=376 /DNA_END=2475 /DNA_ORIENTATION=-